MNVYGFVGQTISVLSGKRGWFMDLLCFVKLQLYCFVHKSTLNVSNFTANIHYASRLF